ncbi:MAG: hypothetical protein Q9160_007682 [Pyrenula sp. 1 TL-2023]
MEHSSLTLAHNHARNALSETRKSNPVAASEEHDLAATEYAAAIEGISDSEALRTLNLLEQHHKKLGQILKFQHENPSTKSESLEGQAPESTPKVERLPDENPKDENSSKNTAQEHTHAPPRLAPGSRSATRKVSTSIASNLASARGIPPNQQSRRGATASPTLSVQQADGRFATHGSSSGRKKTKNGSSRHETTSSSSNAATPLPTLSSKVPEPILKADQTSTHESQSPSNEQTFQQFYSAFETVISKISAPLAFASIPLTGSSAKPAAEPKATPSDALKKLKAQPWTNDNPSSSASIHANAGLDDSPVDYSKLISKAAFRAVSEDNPSAFGNGNPAESFYVVPTTGGTVSYAGILNLPEKTSFEGSSRAHTRKLSNISEDTIDNFVDAREMPSSSASASPEISKDRQSRKQSKRQDSVTKTVGGKSMEELYLENQTLRNISDNLSKRLHMWEVNAQSSSAALQQSLRSLGNHPRGSSPGKPPLDGVPEGIDKTVADLEEIVRKAEADKERYRRESEKLKDVVERYRDRWEKLKEGARARKEGQGLPRPKPDMPLDRAHENGSQDEVLEH